jgi:site-specific recombinase XerD
MKEKVREYLGFLERVRFSSEHTLAAYSQDLHAFLDYLEGHSIADLKTITRAEVKGFLMTFKNKAPASMNRALAAVRGFFRFCRRFEYLDADPTEGIESVPQDSRLPAFLMESEAAHMLESIDGTDFQSRRDRAILEFLYSTGCRVSETLGLTVEKLDLRKGRAQVMGKGRKERCVFLAAPAVVSMGLYLRAREAQLSKVGRRYGEFVVQESVFINRNGGPLTARSVQTISRDRAVAARVLHRTTPHTFRHSFATACFNHGADMRVVQELLGHSNVSTTARYTHVNFTKMAEVYRRAFPHAERKGAKERTEGFFMRDTEMAKDAKQS